MVCVFVNRDTCTTLPKLAIFSFSRLPISCDELITTLLSNQDKALLFSNTCKLENLYNFNMFVLMTDWQIKLLSYTDLDIICDDELVLLIVCNFRHGQKYFLTRSGESSCV